MIEMSCPECGHRLRIKEKYAGRKGKCKYCEAHFIVPEDEDLSDGTAPPLDEYDSDDDFDSDATVEERAEKRHGPTKKTPKQPAASKQEPVSTTSYEPPSLSEFFEEAQSPPPPAVGSARRKHPFLRFCVFFLLVAGGLAAVGWYIKFKMDLAEEVDAAYTKVRAAGYPLTLAELDRAYLTPSAGMNAADAYAEALGRIQEVDPEDVMVLPLLGEAPLPAGPEPLPEGMQAALMRYVTGNAQALRMLQEASDHRYARYPIDLMSGGRVERPYLDDVLRGTRLLALKAIYFAETGNEQEAVEGLKGAICLARSLDEEPLLASQAVRGACFAEAARGLERVLNHLALSHGSLDTIARLLSDVSQEEPLARACAGERCLLIDAMDASKGRGVGAVLASLPEGDAEVAGLPPVLFYTLFGFRERDLLGWLAFYETLVAAAASPSRGIPEISDLEGKASAASRFGSLVTSVPLDSSLGESLTAFVRGEALLRAGICAVAVERFRLDTSHLPGSLTVLIPNHLDAIPRDSCDGLPMRYRTLAQGYRLHSVGPDLQDNGGDASGAGPDGQPRDIVFSVGR